MARPAAISPVPSKPRPVGVFLSYAIEDDDIVSRFDGALQDLSYRVRRNITIFHDRDSIKPGDGISTKIREQLKKTDYLLVFYTGALKKSHSWTGVELGFFQGLIEQDMETKNSTKRKIVPVYLDEVPAAAPDKLGISIQVRSSDLRRPRAEYEKKIKDENNLEVRDGLLAKFLKQVAGEALNRLPPAGEQDEEDQAQERQKEIATCYREIENTISPKLFISMYDCLGGRVARHSIEQKLIEFQIEERDLSDAVPGIPLNSKLVEQGDVLRIFGIDEYSDSITWSEFAAELKNKYPKEAQFIIRAVERVFESAMSKSVITDNEQLIRSPVDNRVYRIIVTRHSTFFNGQKTIHMYFIEKLKTQEYGDETTSMLVSFVNAAVRYRSIFIESQSILSVQAFELERQPEVFRDSVHLLMQELILIEDESARLRLNSNAATVALFGESPNLVEIKEMSDAWYTTRERLRRASEAVLSPGSQAGGFEEGRNRWIAVLAEFTEVTRRINSVVALRAMDRLTPFFEDLPQPSAVSLVAASHHDGGRAA